ATLDKGDRNLIALNARGTMIKERWYQSLVPVMNPEQEVIQVLAPRIGVSAVLGFWTLVIALPLGLLLALPAALREGGAYDRIAGFGAIAATSVPEFAWAMLATVVFVFQLGWPGTTLPGAAVTADAQFLPALVLPVLVLVAFDVGYVQRLARTALVDVMGRPFMATAQMKGLGQGRILFVHGLPHLVPLLLSILALQINWVMSGVIVAEVAFAQDGLGRLIWDAALAGDTSLLQACAMLAAGIAILSRALADALLAATWRRGPARW
ncbi:MAG: ABC transporter permease subunit, partial [Rhodospirillales bacterium]